MGSHFPSQAEGKITPHGLYDINQNIGYIRLGISHDTSRSLPPNASDCGSWNMGNITILAQSHFCYCVIAVEVTMRVIIFLKKSCNNYLMS